MKMEDGTVSAGSYDLVPILNDFIDEHPDFSYKGAKAIYRPLLVMRHLRLPHCFFLQRKPGL